MSNTTIALKDLSVLLAIFLKHICNFLKLVQAKTTNKMIYVE